MKKQIILVLFALFICKIVFAAPLSAQVDQIAFTVVAENTVKKSETFAKRYVLTPNGVKPAPNYGSRTELVAWSIAASAAIVLDAETTMQCENCTEANILMRPFVSSRWKLYGAQGALLGASIYWSNKMREEDSRWRLPLILQIVAHGVAGALNLRYF